jgi:hypothetical protein
MIYTHIFDGKYIFSSTYLRYAIGVEVVVVDVECIAMVLDVVVALGTK